MKEKIWESILNVRKSSPLVHNITNYVVMNNTANALLAVGASPIMAHAEDEVQDMVLISGALVINMGTLSERWVNAMKLALVQANSKNKPVVFDPVGAGASAYRNRVIGELMNTGRFTAVRGNASEIIAMVSADQKTKGVDSTVSSDAAFDSARYLNEKYGTVVCISGATDYVVDGKKIAKVRNGHEMMTRVTGLGCTSTALIGAFIATEKNTFLAVTSAMALIGVAAELVIPVSNGPGSLQMNLLDKLYNITQDEFMKTIKLETEHV